MAPKSDADNHVDNHLVLVLYAGDMADAHRRWRAGDEPVYRAHNEFLELGSAVAGQGGRFTFLGCSDGPHAPVELEPGVWYQGLGFAPWDRPGDLSAAVASLAPTHLVIHFPMGPLLRWASDHRGEVRTIAVNADSFPTSSLRLRFRARRAIRDLNRPGIEIIANHGLPATEAFRALGADPARLVAYDFRNDMRPGDTEPKGLGPNGAAAPTLVYVGSINLDKGVVDLVEAVAELRRNGTAASVTLFGGGDIDLVRRRADDLGLGDAVQLPGVVGNREARAAMARAELVVVPSRPAYPEGFPLTVLEAVASRTPIVVSDHPVFSPLLRPGRDVEMFRAGDPADLARAVARALEPEHYARLSAGAVETWDRLQVPLNWTDMILGWFAG